MSFNTFVSILMVAVIAKCVITGIKTETPESNSLVHQKNTPGHNSKQHTAPVTVNPPKHNNKGPLPKASGSKSKKEKSNTPKPKPITPKPGFKTTPKPTATQLTTVVEDYSENENEMNATAAPEMDPNAQLVDENGRPEDKNEDSEDTVLKSSIYDSITAFTRPKGANLIKSDNPLVNETPVKTVGKTDPKSWTPDWETLKEWYNNIIIGYNVTEACLESTQDSGFWCDGTVDKLLVRYYYRKDTQTCDCFLYYGCFGNKNNFETIKECKSVCKHFGYNEKQDKKKEKAILADISKSCEINP